MDAATAIRMLGGARAEALAAAVAAEERAMVDSLRTNVQAIPGDLRLRDVRRVLGRIKSGWVPRHDSGATSIVYAAAPLLFDLGSGYIGKSFADYIFNAPFLRAQALEAASAQCDRLISRHGPDALVRDLVMPYLPQWEEKVRAVIDETLVRLVHCKYRLNMSGDFLPGFGAELFFTLDDKAKETMKSIMPDHADSFDDEFIEVEEGDHNSDAHDKSASNQGVSANALNQGVGKDMPHGTSELDSGLDGLTEATKSTSKDAAFSNDAGKPACQGESGSDELTAGMGSHLDAARGAGDNSLAGNQVPALTSDGDGNEDSGDGRAAEDEHSELCGTANMGATASAVRAGGGDAGAPVASSNNSGGYYLDMAAVLVPFAVRERQAAKQFAAHLRRIVETACAPRGKASHRIDARALMREIVSYRYAMHRIHREEADLKDVVIAVDESGSCAATVDAVYRAAVAVAREVAGDRVSVMLHSNGYSVHIADDAPCAYWLRREIDARNKLLARHYFSASQQEASFEIWQAIAKRRPGLVIAMGDSDADWALREVHNAGVRVVMLAHMPYDTTYDVAAPVVDIMSAAAAIKTIK